MTQKPPKGTPMLLTTISRYQQALQAMKQRKAAWTTGLILLDLGLITLTITLLGQMGERSQFLATTLIVFVVLMFLSTGTFIVSVQKSFDTQVLERFQGDVRNYALKQYGLTLPASSIQPDLDVRLTHALKNRTAWPVQLHFPDEDSHLTVSELHAAPEGSPDTGENPGVHG